MHLNEHGKWMPKWKIEKFATEADAAAGRSFEVVEFDHNLLLNEGIAELWDLAAGLGTPAAFNAANSFIGVGDSSTAEAAAQTGLQAATNKLYKAMQATYPSRSGQTVSWQSQFTGAEANYAWNEFTIANGNSDAAKNLNRKVSAQGTKTAGQVWTVTLQITIA